MFIDAQNDGITIYTKEVFETDTISITFTGELVNKIDDKYLPEFTRQFVDGGSNGSIRSINSAVEDSDYKMGEYAFAEGYNTKASGNYSHAEGYNTTASGNYSHAEGSITTASGNSSHAEGSITTASGTYSHAEGRETVASGLNSHAEGHYIKASSECQHVQGRCNVEDTNNTYAHIVGNGTADNKRSNAHTLDWKGNAWYAGDVYVSSTSGTNKDEGSKKLATEEYVDTLINTPKNAIKLVDTINGCTYLIQMKNGNLVSRCIISRIEVTTMPNKVSYYPDQYFDPTGMVVTAVNQDNSTFEITNYTLSGNENLITEDTTITISYTDTDTNSTYTTSFIVNAIDITEALADFEYTTNDDGTYTITSWKETLNGEASTEMIVPDNSLIKL
jgi:hypothetical protein